jgi:hypothetical protein
MAKDSAAAVPEKKSLRITEFLLRTREGDVEQGLFSHPSESVARHKRDSLLVAAHEAGRPAPNIELVKRVCAYPLDGNGKPMANGSTCDEAVLTD